MLVLLQPNEKIRSVRAKNSLEEYPILDYKLLLLLKL